MAESPEFANYLGLRHDSREVRELLRAFQILREPRLPLDDVLRDASEVAEPQDFLMNRGRGVEFGFEDEAAFLGAPPSEWGTGPMLLTQVYLFVEHPDQSRYSGPLPFDLASGDSRRDVRIKMSQSGAKLRSKDRDTWVFRKYLLTADYGGEDGTLAYIVLLAEPRHTAPDTELAARCPDMSTVHSIMGRASTDSFLKKSLIKIGYGVRGPWQHDTNESILDCREEFGAYAEFFRTGSEGAPVLTRFQMLGDRRYGSALWPGELPGGMTFDSDWSDVLDRAGCDPDEIAESDFTVLAYWRNQDIVTEVEYSTMENRILSVSFLFSPIQA